MFFFPFFPSSKASLYVTSLTHLKITGNMVLKFVLSPLTKRNLKALFRSETLKHKHSVTLNIISWIDNLFLASIKIKISLMDRLTYFIIKYQFKASWIGKISLFSNHDKQKHEFWWKSKWCSKAIITFLGKEKHHLIKEHKTNTYDQRIKSERNTQREI